MFKKAVLLTRPTPAFVSPAHPPIAPQSITRDAPLHGRGRSKRRNKAYSSRYVESLSVAITRLAGTRLVGFFNILNVT
jgi:hypothetical protein